MPSTLWGINTIYIIIAVAALLLLVILLSSGSGKRKQTEQVAQTAIPTPAAPAVTPVAAIPAQQPVSGLNAKTVAAIMAAVSAASGTPVNQLRFTAIRRVSGIQGPWASSGTANIIASRQTYL